MALELQYDQSLIGKEHHMGIYHVTKDLVIGLCAALNEKNPIYTDESESHKAGYAALLAPPYICALFRNRARVPDIKLNFGKTTVHAGQMLKPLAPILVGDVLTASTHLQEVYPKTGRTGTMVFIVWETIFTNQNGEQVAIDQESYAMRE